MKTKQMGEKKAFCSELAYQGSQLFAFGKDSKAGRGVGRLQVAPKGGCWLRKL